MFLISVALVSFPPFHVEMMDSHVVLSTLCGPIASVGSTTRLSEDVCVPPTLLIDDMIIREA